MSVSCKLGSEDSVTSKYKLPVIDLCSDEERNGNLQPVKASEKRVAAEELSPTTVKANCHNLMKLANTQPHAERTKKNNKGPCVRFKGSKKKRKLIYDDPPSVIIIATSDDTDG